MRWLEAAYAVQVVVALGAPLALAAWLRRRTRVGYRLVAIGGATFIASQIVHVPLNWLLGLVVPSGDGGVGYVALAAAVAGLSAGVCEEVARYVIMRARSDVRDSESALMLGAGHGGIECMIVGALSALALVNLATIDRVGVEGLGLAPSEAIAASAQLTALTEHPLTPIVGAIERLMVLPFHLAATLIVLAAVVRRRPALLVVAILFHAALDGVMVFIAARAGVYAAEIWIGAVGVVSLFVIALLGRSLARPRAVDAEHAPPSGEPIELAGATKIYEGDVRALRDVSLTIARGTRTCLLGPNGAGKTTTIRLLTGGLTPTTGRALLFGRDAEDDAFTESKLRLGVVPQQPGMYEDLTVRAWLALVRDLYGRGDVDAVARDLALGELLDRPMAKLSGGQKRRVAIAAAILGEPELLVLDEPTAGLDPVAAREVLDELHRLSPTRTILLCTHDLDDAEELCDRVVVLRGGRVLVHEDIEALKGRVAPRLALRVHGDDAPLEAALRALGHEPVREDGELSIAVSEPARESPALLRELLGRGVDVTECRVVRPSLEEVFLALVKEAPDIADEGEGAPDAASLDPLPPAVPMRELFSRATRLLVAKEWRQLKSAKAVFFTTLFLPLFMLLLVPQSLIAVAMGTATGARHGDPLPNIGFLGEVGEDPRRLVVALLPIFLTIVAVAVPTALITHSIIQERETRSLELLAALPVRIQQVIAAKIACVWLFAGAVAGSCAAVLLGEMLLLGLATFADVIGLAALLFAGLGYGTSAALMIALIAKDFRTANNVAGPLLVPAIFGVMIVSALIPGGPGRPFVCALLLLTGGLALMRSALRGATFEKLLA